MQDDWKPGDLALCVRDDWENDGERADVSQGTPEISRGSVLEVSRVVLPKRDYPQFVGLIAHPLYLSFAETGPRYGYRADWFKKIDPLTEEEEREFKADLDADRTKREPVYQGNYLGVGIYKVPYLFTGPGTQALRDLRNLNQLLAGR